MARIDLKKCTVKLKDGFGGSAKVNQTAVPPANGNTTLVIDTVAALTGGGTVIPVGAGFSVVGSSRERYAVTAVNSNEVQTVTISALGGTFTLTFDGQTTAPIAYGATAAAVQSALEALSNIAVGDVLVTGSAGGPWTVEFKGVYLALGVTEMTISGSSLTKINEVQTVAIDDASNGGHFHLTYSGQTTGEIAWNAEAAAVAAALKALSNIGDSDVSVTGGPGPGTDWVVEFTGALGSTDVAAMTGDGTALTGGTTDVTITETIKGVAPTAAVATTHPGATTWQLTFTPALATADGVPADDAVITFLPQEVSIKVGDGDLKYSESSQYKYDLDRGELDTVRAGDEVPVDVTLNLVYEHITTGTGETVAPMDALKQRGSASGWFSSAIDQCEPYAVDIEVIHTPTCGTAQKEKTVFPDFRAEKADVSFKDASISASGKAFATAPTTTRY